MKKIKLPPITIIIGIIILIGGLVFVLKYSDKKSILGIKLGKKTVEISKENFKDSDNDGLRDWEEELFRTDIHNPDTDGDGYLDGEEVDSGHNPLVKAPGDEQKFHSLPLGEKYNITKKVLSDEIISSLLDSYISQKASYINDHEEIDSAEVFTALTKQSTIETMARWALADAYPVLFEKAQQTISEMPEIFEINITDKDIKISEDNSRQAIELYLSQVSSFLNSDIFFLQEQSFQVLLTALQDNDFSKLDKLIKFNDEKIEKLKEIAVPSSWKENHKKRLKYTILIRNIFVSFRDVQNDFLKSYIALEEFEQFVEKWNVLVEETVNLAKSQGISIP